MKFAVFTLITLGFVLLMQNGEAAQKKVVCYYTNWSTYRGKEGQFTPEDIDPTLCTHVLYSFLVLQGNSITIHDQWIDVDNNYFNRVLALKQKNPDLKVLAAIGGWNNGSPPFSAMARTAGNRRIFIDSVLDLFRTYKFDGLDLDWEFPGHRGGDPTVDKDNFSLLIQELKSAFKRFSRQQGIPNLLLSSAVNPAPAKANIAYDRATICRDLDFVNLMQYDIHGAWDRTTGFSAPLRNTPGEITPENVIEKTTQEWIDAGCDRDKLILGLPLYGRGWRSSSTVIPSSATGGSAAGRFTGESGILAYYEICEHLNNGWRETYDSTAEQAIATGQGQIVTYDNEQSMKAKVNFLNQLRLGGAMVWALDFDDFKGEFCNRGRYPLLTEINRQLGIAPRPTTSRPRTTRRPGTTRRPTTRRPTTRRPTTRRSTTRRPTTRRPTTRRPTTSSPGNGCEPICPSRSINHPLANRCNASKFHMCVHGRLYTFRCGGKLIYDKKCKCCVRRR